MKYRFLLFDLDNTLLDFDANEAQALPRVFAAHGVTLTPEIRAVYDAINHGLWQDYEAGKVAIETVLNTRFAKTMQHGNATTAAFSAMGTSRFPGRWSCAKTLLPPIHMRCMW